MSSKFRVACVQMRTGKDIKRNIEQASDLIRAASDKGAAFVATPETTHYMELGGKELFTNTKEQAKDLGLKRFRELAAELDIHLLIGSLTIKLSKDKVANRSFLISNKGEILATYDKVHMFDVQLESGESYQESKNFKPGKRAVVADIPGARVGLSVCYDLRFPYLYRALAQAGAQILTIPSAFTQTTGEAHWHILLRARAIETGCYVMAPAQGGTHENGRKTYGHSVIVDPWGEVLAEASNDPGVIWADIQLERVSQVRAQIPSLRHDREIVAPAAAL